MDCGHEGSANCENKCQSGRCRCPSFFGKKEKDRIVATDFLVHFDNGKGLDLQAVQRELGTAIIDMMCSAPFPSEIFIPIELPSWEIDQIDIFHGESGMVFRNIEPHVVM